jgi:hypothetical protein
MRPDLKGNIWNRENPNSKNQAPNNYQKKKNKKMFGILNIGICLEFGIWSLEFIVKGVS